jgi:hypothetical protein
MKIINLLTPCVLLCAVGALAGCASTERPASESALDETNLQRAETQPAPLLSQEVIMDEGAFRETALDSDGTVKADESQRLDTGARAKEYFSAQDKTDAGQSRTTESPIRATKHSKPYHFFWDNTIDSYFSWDREAFQQPGWQLFSFQF